MICGKVQNQMFYVKCRLNIKYRLRNSEYCPVSNSNCIICFSKFLQEFLSQSEFQKEFHGDDTNQFKHK